MVDKVRLTPQQFSKRGGGISVPGSGDIPSLRNIRTVQDTGTEAQARALMSMADDGARLAAMAGEQAKIHLKEVQADQALEAEKVYSNSLAGLSKGVEDIRQTTDNIEEIPGKTLEFYDQVSSDVVSKTEGLSSYQREVLSNRFNQARLPMAQNAVSYQANLRDLERKNNVTEIIQSTSTFLYNNPGALDSRMAQLRQSLSEAGLNNTEVEAQLLRANSQLASTAIKGLVQQNPSQALQAIKSGQYDVYLDGATKAQLSRYAENSIKKEGVGTSIAQMKALGELNSKIDNVEGFASSLTDEDIANYAQSLDLSDAQIVGLFEKRMDAQIEFDGEMRDVSFVNSALGGEVSFNPFNSEDREKGEEVFDKYILPNYNQAVSAGKNEEAEIAATDFITKLGFVPKSIQEDIRGALQSQASERVSNAASLVARIESENPLIEIGLDAGTRAKMDAIKAINNYESDPQKVEAKVNELMRTDSDKISIRTQQAREAIKEVFKDGDIASRIQSDLDEWFDFKTPELMPQTAFNINDRYRDAFQNYMVNNPDAESAHEYAMKQARKTVGVFNNQIMEHTPESLGLGKATSGPYAYKYIEDDMNKTFSSLKEQGMKVELVADETTVRMADPKTMKATGRLPAYLVYVMDKYGDVVPMYDEKGEVQTYSPPVLTPEMTDKYRQQELADQVEGQKRKIERIKKGLGFIIPSKQEGGFLGQTNEDNN